MLHASDGTVEFMNVKPYIFCQLARLEARIVHMSSTLLIYDGRVVIEADHRCKHWRGLVSSSSIKTSSEHEETANG